ncbi:hypothetical protein BT93_C1560 [Corymbia citriodora subsp. variegata]|nr:hypothetical protein BT93_C1560 [Corymbia citriodora subsp. variegata]
MSSGSSERRHQPPPATARDSDDRLKLAIAISLLRSRFLKNGTSPPPPPPAESDVLRWKRKVSLPLPLPLPPTSLKSPSSHLPLSPEAMLPAPLLSRVVSRLRSESRSSCGSERISRKQKFHDPRRCLIGCFAPEASHSAAFPQVASCKCYFFDDLGKLSLDQLGDGSDHRFSDVLRRRFLRQVRFRENKRKRDDSHQRRHLSDVTTIDEVEHLCAAADFLVELCDATSSVEEDNFANWSHQAVDFILVKENVESIEGIVNNLILRLVRRMTSLSGRDGGRDDIGNDVQFYVQHLIQKLGKAVYLGQRALVAVSQKIPVVAESILFSDPFDDKFPDMHQYLFILIQLLEFLVSDYLLTWSMDENFDQLLFEEWLTSIIHARKALGVLESSNGLYMLYMDRVVGELARQLGQISSNHKLNPDVLTNLFI